MRKCKVCGVERPLEAFGQTISEGNGKKYRRHECRKCTYARQEKWREVNKVRLRKMSYDATMRMREKRLANDPVGFRAKEAASAKSYRTALKAKIYEAYGGYRCNCCGEIEPSFLSIDHVNNDGYMLRKNGQGVGATLYLTLWREFKRDGVWPLGFQILCMNCQHGKARNNGICPHQASKV